MAVNHYFQSGIPGGRTSEQLLHEDLIIECMKIYGFDVYYMPRQSFNVDHILGEDPRNFYKFAYPIEMYMSNVQGFTGEGDLLSKFGVEIRDQANFIVSRRRWDEIVARKGNVQLTTRPAEGDVIYFPLTKAFFEIRKVVSLDPFFQVGKLYVYSLQCELMQYSSEVFQTDVEDINRESSQRSIDINDYNLLGEDGGRLMFEYYANSYIITENYKVTTIIPNATNEDFELEIDILDFTEKNPFGEVI